MRKQRKGLVLGMSHGPPRDEIIVLGPERDAEIIFRGIEARSPPPCDSHRVRTTDPRGAARRTSVPCWSRTQSPVQPELFVRLQVLYPPEVTVCKLERRSHPHDEAATDSPDQLGLKGPELYDEPPELFGSMQREATFELTRGEGVTFGRNIRFRVLRIGEDQARADLQFEDLTVRRPDEPPYLILKGEKYFRAVDEFADAARRFKEGQLVFWTADAHTIMRGRVKTLGFLERIGDCVSVVVEQIQSTPLRSLPDRPGTEPTPWTSGKQKAIRIAPSRLKPTIEAVLAPANA